MSRDRRRGSVYRNAMGPHLVEIFHPGCIVPVSGHISAWPGLFRRITLNGPAGNEPPLTADGSAFGGKAVAQCAVTGTKYLRNTLAPVSGTIPAGSKYWWAWVQRDRSGAIGVVNFWDLESASVIEGNLYTLNALSALHLYAAGADRVINATITQGRQLVVGQFDGVNASMSVDGVVTSSAYAGLTASEITKISLGAGLTGGSPGNLSFALGLLYVGKPTTQQIAAASALALIEFPA